MGTVVNLELVVARKDTSHGGGRLAIVDLGHLLHDFGSKLVDE
jgi:hypothetical protein